jgi:hypothetical protein
LRGGGSIEQVNELVLKLPGIFRSKILENTIRIQEA